MELRSTRPTFAIIFAVLLSACSSTLIISDPADRMGAPPKGSVSPLSSYLPTNGTSVKLIFVHGVGDHCPGFALGPKGWLSDGVAETIGLHANGALSSPHRIYSDEFLADTRRDEKSYLTVLTQKFLYQTSIVAPAVNIDAIEITWSSLTQWIKTRQLGYDFTTAAKDASDPSLYCVEEVKQEYASPPPRQALNRLIKEQVFNRDLADTLLYVGTYGVVIQRGFADALCHALTGQPVGTACVWPAPSPGDDSRYIFVTHSLGSRIVYDTLLGLVGHQLNVTSKMFDAGEIKQASPFVRKMMANTPVVYMMANQLPMLGLANANPSTRSDDPPQPLEEILTGRLPRYSLAESSLPSNSTNVSREGSCNNLLYTFAEAGGRSERLNIVAFSDTNDLLSWGIPEWYVHPRSGEDCKPDISIANVFVQNDGSSRNRVGGFGGS